MDEAGWVRLTRKTLVLLPAVLASAAVGWLLWVSDLPLGVAGEWVWNRATRPAEFGRYFAPALATGLYIAVVLAGWHRPAHRGKSLLWMAVLLMSAAIMHLGWMDLPSRGLGLERAGLSLYSQASTGYFWNAQRHGWDTFLRNYEQWVAQQDEFHIGTHPPGLFLLNRALLDLFNHYPGLADGFVRRMPQRFLDGLTIVGQPLDAPAAATLAATVLLVWASILATGPVIYLQTRLTNTRQCAWFAAGLWNLIPGPMLFLPLADAAFPFLAAVLTCSISIASRGRWWTIWAMLAGAVLWLGMMLSLAFLSLMPIVAACAFFHAWHQYYPRNPAGRALVMTTTSLATMMLVVAGCCAWMYFAFGLNMPSVWQINLHKHSLFYAAMPRTYFTWIAVNPVEFAIICGPAAFWSASIGLAVVARQRISPLEVVGWSWLVTLLVLNLSGKNLSEVARLWLFLTPMAAVSASVVAERLHLGLPGRLVILFAQAVVALALLGTVEPLLPIVAP